MIDNTPRWIKIGDALSQLLNVALLPRHKETTANESISGRAHRCGWRAERWIEYDYPVPPHTSYPVEGLMLQTTYHVVARASATGISCNGIETRN